MKEFLKLGSRSYEEPLRKRKDPDQETAKELKQALLSVLAQQEDESDFPLTLARFYPQRKNDGANPQYELGHTFAGLMSKYDTIIRGDVTEKAVIKFIEEITGSSPKAFLSGYKRREKELPFVGEPNLQINREIGTYKGRARKTKKFIQYNLVKVKT